MAKQLSVIGWREWVALPGFDISGIKAKIDTGARTSALHAVDMETFRRNGREWVRFTVHPMQRTIRDSVDVETPVAEYRSVKSSNGMTELRPVVVVELEWQGQKWEAELTLTRRDEMGFRLLLGREAVRGRFLVDAGRSFYGGKPSAKPRVDSAKKKKKKKKQAQSATPQVKATSKRETNRTSKSTTKPKVTP